MHLPTRRRVVAAWISEPGRHHKPPCRIDHRLPVIPAVDTAAFAWFPQCRESLTWWRCWVRLLNRLDLSGQGSET